jgi:hypothetical protein
VGQVETSALESIEVGVTELVGVAVTSGKLPEVAVSDDAGTGKGGEEDEIGSALICTEEQAVSNKSKKAKEN